MHAQGASSRVLQIAEALRSPSADDARGRCLGLSLEMCRTLDGEGAPLRLVVWSVKHDADFLDHWAVVLPDSRILDLTRVQVDGRTGLLHDIGDYPSHFVRPRIYPASLLLPHYVRHGYCDADRLPTRFICFLRWLLLRHDIAQVLQPRWLARAGHSLMSLAKSCMICSIGGCRAALEARRDELIARYTEHRPPA